MESILKLRKKKQIQPIECFYFRYLLSLKIIYIKGIIKLKIVTPDCDSEILKQMTVLQLDQGVNENHFTKLKNYKDLFCKLDAHIIPLNF